MNENIFYIIIIPFIYAYFIIIIVFVVVIRYSERIVEFVRLYMWL